MKCQGEPAIQACTKLINISKKKYKNQNFRCPTFPDPEQFEHLSVLGGDRGWSLPLIVDTGSIRTNAPVLEQRAQARYPAPFN